MGRGKGALDNLTDVMQKAITVNKPAPPTKDAEQYPNNQVSQDVLEGTQLAHALISENSTTLGLPKSEDSVIRASLTLDNQVVVWAEIARFEKKGRFSRRKKVGTDNYELYRGENLTKASRAAFELINKYAAFGQYRFDRDDLMKSAAEVQKQRAAVEAQGLTVG